MRSSKRLLTYFLLMLFALWFQSSVIARVLHSIFGAVPQLAFILIVFLAFDFKNIADVALSFFIGLSLDFLSGTLLGPWAAAAVIVYTTCSFLSRRMYVENGLVISLLCFFAVILAAIVNQLLIAHAPQMQVNSWNMLVVNTLKEAIITAIVAPVCFYIYAYFLQERLTRSSGIKRSVS
jgi:rod shape-determining protein MreD